MVDELVEGDALELDPPDVLPEPELPEPEAPMEPVLPEVPPELLELSPAPAVLDGLLPLAELLPLGVLPMPALLELLEPPLPLGLVELLPPAMPDEPEPPELPEAPVPAVELLLPEPEVPAAPVPSGLRLQAVSDSAAAAISARAAPRGREVAFIRELLSGIGWLGRDGSPRCLLCTLGTQGLRDVVCGC